MRGMGGRGGWDEVGGEHEHLLTSRMRNGVRARGKKRYVMRRGVRGCPKYMWGGGRRAG